MTFFVLLGGFVAFGVLWLLLPRASFVVVLTLYLQNFHGIQMFAENSGMWENVAVALILIAGVIGIVLDFIEHSSTLES